MPPKHNSMVYINRPITTPTWNDVFPVSPAWLYTVRLNVALALSMSSIFGKINQQLSISTVCNSLKHLTGSLDGIQAESVAD